MDGVCAVLTGLWWMMAPVIPSNSRHLFREQRRRLFTPPSTVDGNHCKKKFSGPFFASSRSGPAAARTAATANVHCSHHLPPHAIFFCMVFQKKKFCGLSKTALLLATTTSHLFLLPHHCTFRGRVIP